MVLECARCAYLCPRNTNKSACAYLVWVRLRGKMLPKKLRRTRIPLHQKCQQQCFSICAMPKMCVVSGVVYQVRKPLHQKCQQCFWIPSMGVFEMDNANKSVCLVSRAERTCLGTRSGFGCRARMCLPCTKPYRVCGWCGAPDTPTFAPKGPIKVLAQTQCACA